MTALILILSVTVGVVVVGGVIGWIVGGIIRDAMNGGHTRL